MASNNQQVLFGDFTAEELQVNDADRLTLSDIEDMGWLDEEKGQWEEFLPAPIQLPPATPPATAAAELPLHWTAPLARAPGETIGERIRNHPTRRSHRSYRQQMIGFYNFRGIPLSPNDVCFCDYCWNRTRSMLNRN